MAQVVEAVHYLDSQGIYHRDIKDENLVIDKDFKVKLIDFGSAAIENPNEPSPYYKLFFGTTAYAASEVLLKRSYQAAPAEIWTLGVLMSYLLTGMSPFPTEADAIAGHIVLSELPGKGLGGSCLHLMSRCLEPNPQLRAKINEVRGHQWLKGALDDS
jgi:PAS domain-containing serine/threonine kinase